MSFLFIILVFMALIFLLSAFRDLTEWWANRRSRRWDETKQWDTFHAKFEEKK